MDKFATLEPVRLYHTSSIKGSKAHSKGQSLSTRSKGPAPFQRIGRLPVDLHILILTHLAVPDIPAYARCSRALGNLTSDERVWEARWNAFGVEKHHLGDVLTELEERAKAQNGLVKGQAPPTLTVDAVDDDFGDFAAVDANEMGDFVGSGGAGMSSFSPAHMAVFNAPATPKTTFRAFYIRAHNLLKPLTSALSAPPHAVLSVLFSSPSPAVRQQAYTLRLLSLFLSSRVKPLREWQTLGAALRAATDRFEDGLLTAFDVADGKDDESGMKQAAEASWEVWDGSAEEWELGRMWAEKREIFYQQHKWKPLDNFTYAWCLIFWMANSYYDVGESSNSTLTLWMHL